MLGFPTDLVRVDRAFAQQGSDGASMKHRELKATHEAQDIRANNRGGDGGGAQTRPSRLSRRPFFVDPEDVIGYEALYRSARKCWRGVGRKYSAQHYALNIIFNTLRLGKDLTSGKYKEGKTRIVKITYPKPRIALSITFRDRVYQRSLNDNALYPQMVRGFIWDNLACQKGKGTTAARNRMKAMLHSAFLKYGTNKFQILQGDIKGYYDNMVHAVTERLVEKKCDAWTAARTNETLSRQYRFHGDKGYNAGSQMVQIAGISYLDPLDHFVKEELRREFYLKYMDDTVTMGAPAEDMGVVRSAMEAKLEEVGLWFHPQKTIVARADEGITFLGFRYRVTDDGKVLMSRDSAKVKENRRKLRRLANKIMRGEAEAGAIDESWECMRACMKEGNSKRSLRNMERFVEQLKEDIYDKHEAYAA